MACQSYFENDDLFVSHAPWSPSLTLDEASKIDDRATLEGSLIWNRGQPIKRDKYQVFGHNSHWGLTAFEEWGLCLDDSRLWQIDWLSLAVNDALSINL